MGLEAGVDDYVCGAAVVLYTEYNFLSAAASMHSSHLDTGLGCKMTSGYSCVRVPCKSIYTCSKLFKIFSSSGVHQPSVVQLNTGVHTH